MAGHSGPVHVLCAVTLAGRTFLASGDDSGTVRIWNVATAATWLVVPVHHPVGILVYAADVLIAATTAGVLALRFSSISYVGADNSRFMPL